MTRSTVDANILIYSTAVDSPFHAAAAVLIRDLARGPDLVYLFWPVVMAYLRIATNPVVARTPLSATEAQANMSLLLEQPHIRVAGERENFWDTFQEVSSDVRPTANLVPDAHVVALMRENEVGTIWTHDRDFRKFDGIEVRDPFI